MSQELAEIENVETSVKPSKKVDLASRIPEREEIGGYVSSKHAAKIMSEHAGKDVPVTTVNNLAYAGKIEAIKIGGIFLLKKEGEKSVTAYLPAMTEHSQKSVQRQEEKERKTKQKHAKELFGKYVNDAIAKGEMPDLEALKKELGLS